MKLLLVLAATSIVVVAGCAQTDVQPLTQTSFQVTTRAAPACGPTGARTVANRAAAVEVIQRGGDRFVFMDARSGSQLTGIGYTGYGGFQAYNSHNQALTVQMVDQRHPQYAESFSARQILGPTWQEEIAKGVPNTCT
jgi:hypothetical protein